MLQNDNIELIALSSQALSHCVANTVRDIANNFGEENIKKLVLLEDTTSLVANCESFKNEIRKEKLKMIRKTDAIRETFNQIPISAQFTSTYLKNTVCKNYEIDNEENFIVLVSDYVRVLKKKNIIVKTNNKKPYTYQKIKKDNAKVRIDRSLLESRVERIILTKNESDKFTRKDITNELDPSIVDPHTIYRVFSKLQQNGIIRVIEKIGNTYLFQRVYKPSISSQDIPKSQTVIQNELTSESKLEKEDNKKSNIMESLVSLKEFFDNLHKEISNLNCDNEQLKKNIEFLQQKLQETENIKDNLNLQNIKLLEDINNLTKTIKDQQENISFLESKVEDLQELGKGRRSITPAELKELYNSLPRTESIIVP